MLEVAYPKVLRSDSARRRYARAPDEVLCVPVLQVGKFSPFVVVDHEADLLDLSIWLGDFDHKVIAAERRMIGEAPEERVALDAPLSVILRYRVRVVGKNGHIQKIDLN